MITRVGRRKRRGRITGATVVLNRADRADLRRAGALTRRLAHRELLVAVDGGLQACRESRKRPDLFVGDGDSATRIPADIPALRYPTDKDFSDFAATLRELASRRVHVVSVAGLLGGRLDHEWSNVQEAGRWSSSFDAILAPAERGLVVVTARGCRATTARGRTVSLFPLGPAATITLRGTRWELQRRRMRPGSLGLSNLTGARFELTVHSGAVAVVFVPPGL